MSVITQFSNNFCQLSKFQLWLKTRLLNLQKLLTMPSKIGENSLKLDNLRPHQEELQHLSELAGIYMDSKVFRILIELMNMGFDPETIHSLLKSIKRSRYPKSNSSMISQKAKTRMNI